MTDPTALADEAAMLRRMAFLADADGRDDLAQRFRSLADADDAQAKAHGTRG